MTAVVTAVRKSLCLVCVASWVRLKKGDAAERGQRERERERERELK